MLTVLLEPGYGTILESRCGITLFVIEKRVWVTTETRDGQAERLLNTKNFIMNTHAIIECLDVTSVVVILKKLKAICDES